jgi:hypothetical protein
VKNGTETDVDCGGSCGPCGDGKTCAQHVDCASGICHQSACAAPACDDLVKNGSESDVDCGGSCPPCDDDKACLAGSDCTSKHCSNTDGLDPDAGVPDAGVLPAGTCVAPTCDDGYLNQDETDLDCGGMTCKACGVGQHCLVDADCASRNCKNQVCDKPLFSVGDVTWTVAKPNGATGTATSGPGNQVKLDYSMMGNAVWSTQTWTFTATAPVDFSFTYDWTYEYFHAWFQPKATATAWANGPNGMTSTPLYNGGAGGGTTASGRATMQVSAGKTFGFTITGSNFDQTSVLRGTLTVIQR